METRSKASRADGLTDQQRRWLAHVQRAEGRGESLTEYARRHGLKVSSLYETKRRLSRAGLLPPAKGTSSRKASRRRFVALAVRREPVVVEARGGFRIQLPNGTVLEWSEAPAAEKLRELLGALA